jgi:sialate O-acetylesterase
VHALTVAMDLNRGAAWGFFLRLRRCGLSAAEVRANAFSRPVYSV